MCSAVKREISLSSTDTSLYEYVPICGSIHIYGGSYYGSIHILVHGIHVHVCMYLFHSTRCIRGEKKCSPVHSVCAYLILVIDISSSL